MGDGWFEFGGFKVGFKSIRDSVVILTLYRTAYFGPTRSLSEYEI